MSAGAREQSTTFKLDLVKRVETRKLTAGQQEVCAEEQSMSVQESTYMHLETHLASFCIISNRSINLLRLRTFRNRQFVVATEHGSCE